MNNRFKIKELHSLKYLTGAHPDIQNHYKQVGRPREFGNKVWATSLVLLNYLHERPFELKGLRVLEVGCGWGLLGVYLAKEFGCIVTCSDLDEHVLPIVELHAKLNDISVKTMKASFSDLNESKLKNFDLIIGAEICYSEEVAQQIIELIKKAASSKVNHLLIADPGRPDFDNCIEYCLDNLSAKVIELPGSVNGKTTQLLSTF